MNPRLTFFTTLLLLHICNSGHAAIFHLATPATYDNAEPSAEYGQTFVAVDSFFGGVQLYINDPARPGNPLVNELVGPAELVLYDASDLLNPTELHRSTVLQPSEIASGLMTFWLDAPVATTVGDRYFFSLRTSDMYGIGLRSTTASTYAGGAEAFRSGTTGQITEAPVGRDLSFAVLNSAPVPEPASLAIWSLFGAAVVGGGWRWRRGSRAV